MDGMTTPDTFPQSPEGRDIEIPLDGLDQATEKKSLSTAEMMRVFGMRIQELREQGKSEQADKMVEMLKLLAQTATKKTQASADKAPELSREHTTETPAALRSLMQQTPDELRATLHYDAIPEVRKWVNDVAREERVKDPTFNMTEFTDAMMGRPAPEILRAYLIATELDHMPDEREIQEEFIRQWKASAPQDTPLPDWLRTIERGLQKQVGSPPAKKPANTEQSSQELAA